MSIVTGAKNKISVKIGRGVALAILIFMSVLVLIPVPVLGAVIGNMAGMYACEISKAYLGAAEQRILKSYFEAAEKEVPGND